ncbi:HSPBB protein, partial [Crypturellus soui]|nr:HSPBB protein [Crypturellus soui]
MLCRLQLAPPGGLFPWPGPVRTLWPQPGALLAELERELRLEMERARDVVSSFERLFSTAGAASAAGSSDEGFCVSQDVKDFAPEQLSVKVVGRKVVLLAQRETQSADAQGAFSYKYEVLKREWEVPREADAEALSCSLRDGRLRIAA